MYLVEYNIIWQIFIATINWENENKYRNYTENYNLLAYYKPVMDITLVKIFINAKKYNLISLSCPGLVVTKSLLINVSVVNVQVWSFE